MKRLMILLLILSAAAGCATKGATQCPIEPASLDGQTVTVTDDAVTFANGSPKPGKGIYFSEGDYGQIMAYLLALEQAVGCD